MVYADRGTNDEYERPGDIFFTSSTDSGTNWTSPLRVNTDATTNDQWMPVLAVKPDGTQLFMAWYDRRNDTNNSFMEVYGRFGTIATNGSVTFGSEFVISTANFPPVFAGTLISNTNQGHYDPVYPPGGVSLNWWYPDVPLTNELGQVVLTFSSWKGHVGEYNGAFAGDQYVYVTWTDSRMASLRTLYPRDQSDIRFVKLTWPQ